MNYKALTDECYSKWLGIDIEKAKNIEKIYYEERNIKQKGYSGQIDLYVFCKSNKIIISYGNKAENKINDLCFLLKEQKRLHLDLEKITNIIEALFNKKPGYEIKYVFNELPVLQTQASLIKQESYPSFLEFFKQSNGIGNDDAEWIQEYFYKMAQKEYCYGVFCGNKIVCATDAPDMPYMCERIQEIGISTLPDYQRKGYAKTVCIALIKSFINKNICPIWSADAKNIASQKLAESLGFIKYSDVLFLQL